ncbi:MAG: universal stress protein [Rhodobacteraceae bacterium]|nr:universal stress protein [Paracoccaceae bacterium]MCF8513598.1 universal stress protein [Paracoccaceae bacterium]MCF8517502.1 universal stress protein [Paracoccaceae bacterium]
MAYNSILTAASSTDSLSQTIATAAKICAAHDAHLDILALGIDRMQAGYSYMGLDMATVQVALERAETDARLVEAAALAAIQAETPSLRASVETLSVQRPTVGEVVGRRARFADLVVLPRPYGSADEPGAEAIIEAALFEGRAPVLVLPKSGIASAAPEHIIIAWNQSPEAMVAVRLALPFLRQAKSVSICVIDPPTHGPERSDPGGLLCQMLVRHGVKAEVTVLARTLPRVSDVLLRHVVDQNADLLVMGAYGHSRFRESILGGPTRDILEQTLVPVLMAH